MIDAFADKLSEASLGVAVVSVGVAFAAYRKSAQADLRDRTAVVIVTPIWERVGDDASYYKIDAIRGHERPLTPELHFAIDTLPGKPLVDGITIRKALPSDDPDHEQWYSQHKIIKVENAGRSAAIDCQLHVDLCASFFVRDADFETEAREFPSVFRLGGIPAGGHKYLEVRNLLGTVVVMRFTGLVSGVDGKQPVALDARDISFHGRGPWSYLVTPPSEGPAS